MISIHALLTESDLFLSKFLRATIKFQSTLSSRRATHGFTMSEYIDEFQSTLSSRRATMDPWCAPCQSGDFNPRSPHGERRRVFSRLRGM